MIQFLTSSVEVEALEHLADVLASLEGHGDHITRLPVMRKREVALEEVLIRSERRCGRGHVEDVLGADRVGKVAQEVSRIGGRGNVPIRRANKRGVDTEGVGSTLTNPV